MRVRVSYVLKLRTGGLWGSGQRLLGADIVTATCRHASGSLTLCVPAPYVKGLLRRSLEELIDHLTRLGILGRGVLDELFGPLTPFSESASSRPPNTVVAPLYPAKGIEAIRKLAEGDDLEYLIKGEGLVLPKLRDELHGMTYVEPHVRIDDRSGRAAEGALFQELRVVPEAMFYGEVIHYLRGGSGRDHAIEIARALVLAVASLNSRYVGRRTVATVYVVGVKPENLREDEVIREVLSEASLPSG